MSFIFAPAALCIRIMFSLSDDTRGEESALRLNKRRRNCFPQSRVRSEGELRQGTS